MMICLEAGSATCLLFDSHPEDLTRVVEILQNTQKQESPWYHPLAFFVILTQECGRSSEVKRKESDLEILVAEVQTQSTPWNDLNKTLIKWPKDFYQATSILHKCHNQLVFLNHAVNFEIQVWKFLQQLLEDKKFPLPGKLTVEDDEHQSVRDEVAFQLAYTTSRKGQISCLRDRVQVQIELVRLRAYL
jgi:hypothetical protein